MTYRPVQRAERQLDALGDSRRREIVAMLADGPASVGALAARLPISRPAVSQHLRVLKDAGLVLAAPEGTRRVYSLDPAGPMDVRAYLDRFWAGHLAAYAAMVAEEVDGATPRDQEEPA